MPGSERDFRAVNDAARRYETPEQQNRQLNRTQDEQADQNRDLLGATHRILQRNEP